MSLSTLQDVKYEGTPWSNQLGVRLSLGALNQTYGEIRASKAIVNGKEDSIDQIVKDLYERDKNLFGTRQNSQDPPSKLPRTNAPPIYSTAIKKHIQEFGPKYFENSTPKQRASTSWTWKDDVAWAVIRIVRVCTSIYLFEENERYISFPMIEAAFIFLQYLKKDEIAAKRAEDRSENARRRESAKQFAPPKKTGKFAPGARVYPYNFEFPDGFQVDPKEHNPRNIEMKKRVFARDTIEKVLLRVQEETGDDIPPIPTLNFDTDGNLEGPAKRAQNAKKIQPDVVPDIISPEDQEAQAVFEEQMKFHDELNNDQFQCFDYLEACELFDWDKNRPRIRYLRLPEKNGEEGRLTCAQVTAIYWLVKKEIFDGVPGLILNDYCGSGKSIILLGFLLTVWDLYLRQKEKKYRPYSKFLRAMDTRPTLLLCPASMIQQWCSKFEENLETNHPFKILLYHSKVQEERPFKRSDPIFQLHPPKTSELITEPFWHNCRIILCSLEAWSIKHPPAAVYHEKPKSNVRYLLLGNPARNEDEVLEGLFARVICDEGHKMKGGAFFERAAAVIGLNATYKQNHTATLFSNSISEYGGHAALLENAESRAAYTLLKDQGLNPFEDNHPKAMLARQTCQAYADWIAPEMEWESQDPGAKKTLHMQKGLSYLLQVLQANLLRRTPSSRIREAVGIYDGWTRENNPEGIIGKDLKDVFYTTIPVEFSPEDYETFEGQVRPLRWLMWKDWQSSRDGQGFISQDSRVLRNISLASNSSIFTRRLTGYARPGEPVVTTPLLSQAKLRRQMNDHQRQVAKLEKEIAGWNGSDMALSDKHEKLDKIKQELTSFHAEYFNISEDKQFKLDELGQLLDLKYFANQTETEKIERDDLTQTMIKLDEKAKEERHRQRKAAKKQEKLEKLVEDQQRRSEIFDQILTSEFATPADDLPREERREYHKENAIPEEGRTEFLQKEVTQSELINCNDVFGMGIEDLLHNGLYQAPLLPQQVRRIFSASPEDSLLHELAFGHSWLKFEDRYFGKDERKALKAEKKAAREAGQPEKLHFEWKYERTNDEKRKRENPPKRVRCGDFRYNDKGKPDSDATRNNLWRYDKTNQNVQNWKIPFSFSEYSSKDTQNFWKNGYSLPEFVQSTLLPKEELPESLVEAHARICLSYPKMVPLLKLVHKILCRKSTGGHKKIVVMVQRHQTMLLLQTQLESLGLRVASIHAGLSNLERIDLMNRFNKLDDLDILLTSYAISGVGLDFQPQCNNIVLFEPAINFPIEEQAIGRIHRIGNRYEQMVYRLFTRGTYHHAQLMKSRKKWLAIVQLHRNLHGITAMTPKELIDIFSGLESENEKYLKVIGMLSDPPPMLKKIRKTLKVQMEGLNLKRKFEAVDDGKDYSGFPRNPPPKLFSNGLPNSESDSDGSGSNFNDSESHNSGSEPEIGDEQAIENDSEVDQSQEDLEQFDALKNLGLAEYEGYEVSGTDLRNERDLNRFLPQKGVQITTEQANLPKVSMIALWDGFKGNLPKHPLDEFMEPSERDKFEQVYSKMWHVTQFGALNIAEFDPASLAKKLVDSCLQTRWYAEIYPKELVSELIIFTVLGFCRNRIEHVKDMHKNQLKLVMEELKLCMEKNDNTTWNRSQEINWTFLEIDKRRRRSNTSFAEDYGILDDELEEESACENEGRFSGDEE